MAADRLSAAPGRVSGRVAPTADVGLFVTPVGGDTVMRQGTITIASDPFDRAGDAAAHTAVASGATGPTVPTAQARGRGLTAILVADERRVAVIDDQTVTVGDALADGARVAAILPDRVFVVERNGRRQMLTLTMRGQ